MSHAIVKTAAMMLRHGGYKSEPTVADNLVAEVERLFAENAWLRAALRDGNRSLPFSRDEYGRMVREAWVRWAQTQLNPKPSWLVPYDELSEPDKEADRQIGEAVARWTMIGDASRLALTQQDKS